jgi:hypothetical protein
MPHAFSISSFREGPNFVIPAKAGIHWLLKVKMDPRAVTKMSGDDGPTD